VAVVRADVRFRQAVRVLLVDEADRVLLFSFRAPRDGVRVLVAPGGGRGDGEDAMVATRREIYEATGLRDLELEAEVWHRLGDANVRRARGGPGCRPGY
jgi:8-oxo-dGTP pyrophosphatase MutT (NUDIX family)